MTKRERQRMQTKKCVTYGTPEVRTINLSRNEYAAKIRCGINSIDTLYYMNLFEGVEVNIDRRLFQVHAEPLLWARCAIDAALPTMSGLDVGEIEVHLETPVQKTYYVQKVDGTISVTSEPLVLEPVAKS